jgi:hypothetical protein
MQIFRNSIITPDGTILVSTHRHDYVEHTDKDGYEYFVDGGYDYLRRNRDTNLYLENSLTTDDPHYTIRASFEWGTRGKDGKDKLKMITLCDMTDVHVLNTIQFIKDNKIMYRDCVYQLFKDELAYRIDNSIYVPDY